MLRRLAIVAIAGMALATAAAPASAATGTVGGTSVRVQAAAPSGGHAVLPDSPRATIFWDISAYKCGGGVIGAQSRQAKSGTGINKLISTHQLQRWSSGSWRTVASRSFVKFSPVNNVWYYAPGPTTRLDWTVAQAGDYRINVVFKYYNNSTLVAQKSRNTVTETGTFCRFS